MRQCAEKLPMQKQCTPQVAFHEDSGGVSDCFHVLTSLAYLSPLTAPAEAKDSSSAISSGVSLIESAPMFWLKFSILVVPGMGQTSFPWWWTQASASCDGVHPFLAAISLTRSNIVLLCSRFSGWNLGRCCNQYRHFSVTNEMASSKIKSWQYYYSKPIMLSIHALSILSPVKWPLKGQDML